MLSKGSVLVVDDEINLCRILGAKLAKNGYSVVAVHDGDQAVEKVRESEFDVVLLDLILPKKDGLTALAEIRSMKQAVPVIIMSACENSDAIDQAMQGGASTYIKKPFDLDSLVTLVQSASLKNGQSHQEPKPEDSTILFVKNQPVTIDIRNHCGYISFNSCIEEKDEHTLSVTAPKMSGDLVAISPKTQVRVGLCANNAYYSFNSYVVGETEGENQLLVLDKPGAIYRIQRRQSPRRPVMAQAEFTQISRDGDDSTIPGQAMALDLSDSGIKLATKESLIPGQFVYLKVEKLEKIGSLSAVAQVMHCRENTEPDMPGFVAGLRFSQIDDKVREALGA